MNVIKVNPIGPIGGQYQAAYERAINKLMSLQLSAGYISLPKSETMGENSFKSTTTGFILIPEYRVYFKEAPMGFYGSVFGRWRSVTEKLTDTTVPSVTSGKNVSYTEKTNTIGGGLCLGFQYVVHDIFSIDIFAGPQFKSRTSKRTYDYCVTDDDFNNKFIDFKIKDKAGFGCRAGISFGVMF